MNRSSILMKNPYKNALLTAVLAFILFALMSSGTTGSGDSMVRYRVARNLITTGDIALTEPADNAVYGRDGKLYAIYGIGQSLLFALPELCVRGVCALTGKDCDRPFWEDISVGLASLILLPLISAVGLLYLNLLLIETGFSSRVASLTALLAGVGSLYLPYAKFHQEENQIAALTFATVYYCVRFRKTDRVSDGVLASVLCFLPLWFRLPAVAESAPLALLILVSAYKTRSTKGGRYAIAALFVAGAGTLAWLMFFNWYRFGGVANTGYQPALAASGNLYGNMAEGIIGPFIHPSKSLFLYSPLLILSAASFMKAIRDRSTRPVAIVSAIMLLLAIIIPSGFRTWGGDTSWGPRYLVAGHMLMLALGAWVWRDWRNFSRALKTCALAVVVWAVCAQIIGSSFNYNLEYHRGLHHTWDDAPEQWYAISKAQIPMRLDSLARFGHVWIQSPAAPRDAIEEYSIPAFLPWKLGQRFGSRVWLITLLIWLAAWVTWVIFCLKFLRRVMRATPYAPVSANAPEDTPVEATIKT